MRKFAIISVDDNPEYYKLLPLTCYSLNKLGYRPAIIWLAGKELLSIMNDFIDADILLHDEKYGSMEGVRKSTLAQLGRLFAHEWERFKPDDILLTSDSDMVIASDIFTHDVSQGQIISYGYDLTGRSELPICYVKATAAKWRELMGEFHIPDAAYSEQWETYWSTDQQMLTKRAHEYGMERITFVDRLHDQPKGLPTGRWDRACWDVIPDSIIDVHMPRNNWDAQYQVAERLWPGEDHSFITKFREALEGRDIGNVDLSVSANINELVERPVCIDILDEFGFMKITGNWDNHRVLLLLGLSLTTGAVAELGSGEGSTPYLRKHCEANGRVFQSFDNNEEWCEKTGAEHVDDWDVLVKGMHYVLTDTRRRGLIFIDHAPGERRYLDAIALANAADVLVLHDTEEGGAGNYMWSKAWPHFKYRLNYNRTGGGAGATLVSNKIDVNRFRGLSLGPYTFDND
jgi:hypothetical protein